VKLCSIKSAPEQIRTLVELVTTGEEVLLTNDDGPIARIVPIAGHGQNISKGTNLVEIFKQIRALGGVSIEDPVAWQKETRQDRSLPGRD